MKFRKTEALKGEVTIPGDKSISHRAVMLGAILPGNHKDHQFFKRGGLPLHHCLLPENGHLH